mmetsp:Transcript_34074/g.49501  ORF Transcript_34074/g.49501 Transcript_34074/m.49501 type:complete len:425 (-) Transcript_34074:224-1498(-)
MYIQIGIVIISLTVSQCYGFFAGHSSQFRPTTTSQSKRTTSWTITNKILNSILDRKLFATYKSDSELDLRQMSLNTSTTNNPSFSPIAGLRKNLKTNTASPIMQRVNWNDVKGLSERELIVGNDVKALREEALALSYRRCEYVTKLFSKTFYMGTSLMKPEARKHVWAIYAWCRRTDDIVDSPRALLDRNSLSKDLVAWEQRLTSIWQGQPVDLFDLAMAHTVETYPSLSRQPFQDMILGMVMDVPGLGQERYETFDELYLYCYRVAGTVGLMTLPVLGTAPGYTMEQAAEPAIALGIGLQLTNILRDVGEDLERGRIYLPQDEIKAFGLTDEDLFACRVDNRYKEFMRFQIQRARDYYKVAEEGVRMLHPSARFAVQASLDLYSRILNVLERNDYDNFRKRAFTTKFEKLSILPNSFLKAQKG